ncbi:MAG: Ribosomal large subunit pseudouridine(746) synthase @ tRNA pseudouridine(32) synthase, partial [uncultured Ramlibacter sp.]
GRGQAGRAALRPRPGRRQAGLPLAPGPGALPRCPDRPPAGHGDLRPVPVRARPGDAAAIQRGVRRAEGGQALCRGGRWRTRVGRGGCVVRDRSADRGGLAAASAPQDRFRAGQTQPHPLARGGTGPDAGNHAARPAAGHRTHPPAARAPARHRPPDRGRCALRARECGAGVAAPAAARMRARAHAPGHRRGPALAQRGAVL